MGQEQTILRSKGVNIIVHAHEYNRITMHQELSKYFLLNEDGHEKCGDTLLQSEAFQPPPALVIYHALPIIPETISTRYL